MSARRPEPLQPVYDFSVAPDSVNLLQGAVEMSLSDDRFSGTAALKLRFLPRPRVIFHASIPVEEESALRFVLNDRIDPSFSFRGQKVEGFCGKWKGSASTLELDWHPRSEPVVLCEMRAQTSVAAVLHLFNFPEFWGGQHQATTAPAGCSSLVLESVTWRITFQSLPNNATKKAWDRIKDEGGCFLTHVAKLERKDGKPFSGEEAREQRLLLANFLSFVRGGPCSTACEVGFDAAGQKTWEAFSSPRFSNPPYSWFNPFEAWQAEFLFPLFATRWEQSEEWKDCLRSAIYWYTQANTTGDLLAVDSAIILAQSALERLAHHHLVVDKKMISPEGLNRLKASDRLRLLFSSLNLPIKISSATPDIRRIASSFQWVDAPHALTEIRNELVHPVSKKHVPDCFVDAWKLSLWYLELSVLAVCGYDGAHTSRLTARYVSDSKKVPWIKTA